MEIGKIPAPYWEASHPASPSRAVDAEKEAPPPADNRDVVDFSAIAEESGELEKQFLKQMAADSQIQNTSNGNNSLPKDTSVQLTRKLVGAAMQEEVRTVLMEADEALSKLQSAAIGCDKRDRPKIEAMIRRIKRVLERGNRKIRDLSDEQALVAQHNRAHQAKQRRRVEELKEELRARQSERRNREQKYLREADRQQVDEAFQQIQAVGTPPQLEAADEALISAQAQAAAAAEGAPMGTEVFTAGGGEAAVTGDAPAPEVSEAAEIPTE